MAIDNPERRRELAAFLRARRTAIDPAAAGFPVTGRRRTAGLRREEVAALAEISTTLYTWLEQARPVPVSAAALTRVAAALACTDEETQLVLTLLSGRGPAAPAHDGAEGAPEGLVRLVAHHDPAPAWLIGPRWEGFGQNESARLLFGDWTRLDVADRGLLTLMFTDPFIRTLFRDWRTQARRLLAEFRLSTALHSGDPVLSAMVDRVGQASPEFRQWWQEYPAQTRGEGTTTLDHPELGPLVLQYVPMRTQDGTGIRATFLVPADEATADTLRSTGIRPRFSPTAAANLPAGRH
ncbi:helix-turn-helix transcriptional regulator [Amycolatopsis jiangsuensis]|uniref:Transcriptional regulator with XRE-family HTH domain n=1 Tax=Amycolatopsis jiangsuensis TaxID=1181879 RepID=A0A840IR59_9PSEU|nr:helix-turn-helix transcriptional regulator [Amycolatopsis jiangsuensis]MBB4683658.1 transcriptional regulator with XRE-family HTH domain [Amycolatopsis jiangsuensis]